MVYYVLLDFPHEAVLGVNAQPTKQGHIQPAYNIIATWSKKHRKTTYWDGHPINIHLIMISLMCWYDMNGFQLMMYGHPIHIHSRYQLNLQISPGPGSLSPRDHLHSESAPAHLRPRTHGPRHLQRRHVWSLPFLQGRCEVSNCYQIIIEYIMYNILYIHIYIYMYIYI